MSADPRQPVVVRYPRRQPKTDADYLAVARAVVAAQRAAEDNTDEETRTDG